MLRAMVATAVVLVSSPAIAATGESWRADVAPPRPGLPAVTIELGYAGPYVPWESVPITLRATTGDRPFDGYIGFHFRVQQTRSYDTPVIARAVIAPRQEWTFSTFATLRSWVGTNPVTVPRAIAVEWRNASMNVLAFRQAGVPPWAPARPLRIGPDAPATAFGGPAWTERPEALPDLAQWYAGFSHVVAALEVWSDLPLRVREAVVGSGTEIVLFGLPRAGRDLDALDAALLPVAFESRPGSFEVPWPYGSGTAAVPRSWRVATGAAGAGSGPLPYLVRSAVSTWFADERGVGHPLPAMNSVSLALVEARARANRVDPGLRMKNAWPQPAQLLRVHTSLLLGSAAALLGLGCWLLVRRNPRAVAPAALLLAAFVILGARERIRPTAGTYWYENTWQLTGDMVGRQLMSRSWGASPLAEERRDGAIMRTSVSGAASDLEDAEIRAPGTPVSMGARLRSGDWHAVTRWARRHGPGKPPKVRIARREGKTLEVEFESAIPVDFVNAEWLCGADLCAGGTAVRSGTRGTVTIRDGRRPWVEDESFIWYAARGPRPTSSAQVALVTRTRTSTRVQEWYEPVAGRATESFVITNHEWRAPGTATSAFALPAGTSTEAEARVSVQAPDPQVTLRWNGGAATLQPTGRPGVVFGSRSWSVPPDALRAILAGGGMLSVEIVGGKGPRGLSQRDTVSIEIREKKP